jgi:hypothetical protein
MVHQEPRAHKEQREHPAHKEHQEHQEHPAQLVRQESTVLMVSDLPDKLEKVLPCLLTLIRLISLEVYHRLQPKLTWVNL